MAHTYQVNRHHHVGTQASDHASDKVVTEETLTRDVDDNPGITRTQLVIQYLVGLISGLLLIRFLLVLFGANPFNGFVSLIDTITDPLVAPFRGLFGVEISSGAARFEVETLVAIIIYTLIGLGIVRLLDVFRKQPVREE